MHHAALLPIAIARFALAVVLAFACLVAIQGAATPSARAAAPGGPMVLDGMDPVCHDQYGESTGGYLQTVLTSLHAQAGGSHDGSVAVIGSSTDSTCGGTLGARMPYYLGAIEPAPSVTYAGTAAQVDDLFAAMADGSVAPAVLWIPDNFGRPGDVEAALTAHAGDIADFVNSGGALFSNMGSYGWLTALLPSATYVGGGCNGGPAVTEAGRAAFPALTDELVASCWHGYFTGDIGSLVALVDWPYPTPSSPRVGVAIGGASVTLPSSVSLQGPDAPVLVGGSTTVTATITNSSGVPQVGIDAVFTVDAGPNEDLTSTVATDASGEAAFTFGASVPGTDVVTVTATINGTDKTASTEVRWLTAPTPPALALTTDDGSLTATVAPAEADAAAELTSLRLTLQPGDVTVDLDPAGGNHTFSGLTNGTSYTVGATAHNAVGQSTATTLDAVPGAVPGSPTGLVAESTDSQVSLSWTAPTDDGGLSLSGYRVEHSTDGTTWTATDTGSATTSFTVTGLTNGTAVEFRVLALNAAGAGTASDPVGATPVAVPDAPTDVVAVAGNRTVALSWTAPADDGGLELTGYRIEWSTDGATWTVAAADTSSTTTSHTLTGLTNGIRLQFRVFALNSEGAGAASGTATATPRTVPGAPVMTRVTPTNRTLTISYVAPSSDGGSDIVRYEYSIDGGVTWAAVPSGSPVGELVVGGLTNGVTYAVGLRAVNAAGAGPAGAILGATPVLEPILPPGSGGDTGRLPVPVGTFRVLVDGVEQPAEVSTNAPWLLTADGFSVQLEALGAAGEPLPLDAFGRLVVTQDGQVAASGEGFMPGSTVDVWLFSTPVLLGEITVRSDGTFHGVLDLPEGIEVGEHTIQLNGLGTDGSVQSVSTSIVVEASATTAPSVTRLARTGDDPASVTLLGLLLVAGGAAVLARSRRRA